MKQNKIYGELKNLQLGMEHAMRNGAVCRLGCDKDGHYLERIGICHDVHFMNYLKKKIEEKS